MTNFENEQWQPTLNNVLLSLDIGLIKLESHLPKFWSLLGGKQFKEKEGKPELSETIDNNEHNEILFQFPETND